MTGGGGAAVGVGGIGDRHRASHGVVDVGDGDVKGVANRSAAAVGSGDRDGDGADISVGGSAGEGAGGGIEAQPARQSRTTDEGGAEGEGVAINISEGVSRNGEGEG